MVTLYWIGRVALVLAWLAVAVAIVRAQHRAGLARSAFLGCAALAVLFAIARATRWNYGLLELGRAGLRAAGEYDERIVWKVLLALLLAAACALVGWAVWRVRREPGLSLCATGIGLQAVLLAIETFSLDDAMPRFVVQQPGRYLLEGAFVALALLGVRVRSRAGAA